jgi:hypothetical protein
MSPFADTRLRLFPGQVLAQQIDNMLGREEVTLGLQQLAASDRELVLAELRRFAEGLCERGLTGASDLAWTFFPYAQFCCQEESLSRLKNSILPDEDSFSAFRHTKMMETAQRSRENLLAKIQAASSNSKQETLATSSLPPI